MFEISIRNQMKIDEEIKRNLVTIIEKKNNNVIKNAADCEKLKDKIKSKTNQEISSQTIRRFF